MPLMTGAGEERKGGVRPVSKPQRAGKEGQKTRLRGKIKGANSGTSAPRKQGEARKGESIGGSNLGKAGGRGGDRSICLQKVNKTVVVRGPALGGGTGCEMARQIDANPSNYASSLKIFGRRSSKPSKGGPQKRGGPNARKGGQNLAQTQKG